MKQVLEETQELDEFYNPPEEPLETGPSAVIEWEPNLPPEEESQQPEEHLTELEESLRPSSQPTSPISPKTPQRRSSLLMLSEMKRRRPSMVLSLHNTAGALVEIILRYRGKPAPNRRGKVTTTKNQTAEAILMVLARATPEDESVDLLADDEEDQGTMEWLPQAKALILNETFQSQLNRIITNDLKCTGVEEGGLGRHNPGDFIQLAKEVQGIKREVAFLDAEVSNWLLKFRLLHRTIRPYKCHPLEEKEKQVTFWLEYYSRSWDTRVHPKRPAEKLSMLDPEPAVSQPPSRTSSKTRASSKLTASASLPQLRGELAIVKLPKLSLVFRSKYLQNCEDAAQLPIVHPFTTGFGRELDFSSRSLVDQELMPLARTLPEITNIEVVDLSGSTLLSDRCLALVMANLRPYNQSRALRLLNLSRCKPGLLALPHLTSLIAGAESLRHLDLCEVTISLKHQVALCEAIGSNPGLQAVNLSNTHLGSGNQTGQCIRALMRSEATSLDISWNQLHPHDWVVLADCMVVNTSLRRLNLCSCVGAIGNGNHPLGVLLERLGEATNLTYLNISMNQLLHREAQILEDSLEMHKGFNELVVCDNPVGVLGVRCFFRLLASENSGLQHFDTEGCFVGGEPPQDDLVFAATSPGGRYDFDLSRPHHRAILRMLLKTAERFEVSPSAALLVDGGRGYSPMGKVDGIWQVPKSGLLSIQFAVENSIQAALSSIAPRDLRGFLSRYNEVTRRRLTHPKVIPILAKWKDIADKPIERRVYLRALASDFHIPIAHLEYMCKASPACAREAITALLPSINSDIRSRALALMLFPSPGAYMAARRKMRSFVDFNVDNATGHYSLDLGVSGDRAVASSILLLDRWEVSLDLKQGRTDISARGNRSHVRNERYQGRLLEKEVKSLAEWVLPQSDVLELDYVSHLRPPAGSAPLSPAAFAALLDTLFRSPCSSEGRMRVLRLVSSSFYLTSMQLRAMIGFIKVPQHQHGVVVAFFLRLLDPWNSKVFLVRFDFEVQKTFHTSLGCLFTFQFIQPENSRIELDLSYFDQRLLCTLLVKMSLKENPMNLTDFGYDPPVRLGVEEEPDGEDEEKESEAPVDISSGVPSSWATMSALPSGGTFTTGYVCASDQRSFGLRKELAEHFSHYEVKITAKEVVWWTGVSEVPADLVELVIFLLVKLPTASSAFPEFDVKKQGKFNLEQFQTALQTMGCVRFDGDFGDDKEERIEKVFQFLDPSGKGFVSKGDWQVVVQLWTELRACVTEFTEFLLRAYHTIDEAWFELDADESGELDSKEWMVAVDEIGYFGPAAVIFKLLDVDCGGTISRDELEVLERYREAEL